MLDGFRDFAITHLGLSDGLLAFVLVFSIALGSSLGAAILAICFVFPRAFQLATGRPFVFTSKMAARLSSLLGALLGLAFLARVAFAVREGAMMTAQHRGGSPSHLVYWRDSHSDFLWAIFGFAMTMFGLWAMVSVLLFKAGSGLKKAEAAPPPTQSAPPHTRP